MGIHQNLPGRKGTRLLVKGTYGEIITNIRKGLLDLFLPRVAIRGDRFERRAGGRGEEPLAIRTPGRETLEKGRVLFDHRHRTILQTVQEEVTAGIHHLNLVGVDRMENLTRVVAGKGDVIAARMPRGIDAERVPAGNRRLDLHFTVLFADDHRSRMLRPGMKEVLLRITHVIRVTIHALRMAPLHIAVEGALLKRSEIALVDPHLVEAHVAGREYCIQELQG